MKKIYYMLVTALLLTSCVDYQDASVEISAKVQLQMPAEFTKGSDFEGHVITITSGTKSLSAKTDANGIAVFTDLQPDLYDISVSWEITNDAYMALTGEQAVASGLIVSGNLNEQLLSDKLGDTPVVLPTTLVIKRDIVISKISSSGSKDFNEVSYLYGKYLELYNQSSEAVDVSGLYIGLLDSDNPQPFTLDNLHEQFDDSVVIVKQIFQIPTKQPCMVAPGGTLLLVNSAIDHSKNSALEYDLTGADFESKGGNNHQNNPDVDALETVFSVYAKNSILNLVQGGPCGVIIFRTTEDIDQWKRTYPYGKTSGNYFMCVPRRLILDGVDFIKNKATGVDVSTKRLYADIDAGYTYVNTLSGYTGEVVYRRTAKTTADGRKILMDTNNSLTDFKVSTTIKPREYDEE